MAKFMTETQTELVPVRSDQIKLFFIHPWTELNWNFDLLSFPDILT